MGCWRCSPEDVQAYHVPADGSDEKRKQEHVTQNCCLSHATLISEKCLIPLWRDVDILRSACGRIRIRNP